MASDEQQSGPAQRPQQSMPERTDRFTRQASPVPIQALVDIDRELAASLSAEHLEAARAAVEVPVLTRPRGPWHLDHLPPGVSRNIGLLIVDGVAAREIVVGDTVSSELLGA